MTQNIAENRASRVVTAWTVEFARLKKRERIPLILLAAILGLEILRFLGM